MTYTIPKAFIRHFLAFILMAASSFCLAESPSEALVKERIAPFLGDDVTIHAIAPTPYSGLYEIQLGKHIVYTDQNADYFFFGQIFNAKTQENYTRKKIMELNTIHFSSMPKELALKYVKGKGERVIAVFSDPNCQYCQVYAKALTQLDNVTIYTYLYPVLSEDSVVKSKNIWCASNPSKTMNTWMIDKIVPPAHTEKNCDFPLEKIGQLGKQLGLRGVPVTFFQDGSHISGALGIKALEEHLSNLKDSR